MKAQDCPRCLSTPQICPELMPKEKSDKETYFGCYNCNIFYGPFKTLEEAIREWNNVCQVTFAELREVNVARCEAVFHPLNDWSITDWATAMAGECGEACNIVKKIRREFGNVEDAEPSRILQLTHELADLVIYVDLLAARCNIDLGEAVRRKFNLVSEQRGCNLLL